MPNQPTKTWGRPKKLCPWGKKQPEDTAGWMARIFRIIWHKFDMGTFDKELSIFETKNIEKDC